MRRVVLDMQYALCTDAIAEALRRFDPDFDPVMSDSPEKTVFLCDAVLANVLIMEVTAYAPRRLEERMKICDGLKKTNPGCKTVLVVDENIHPEIAEDVKNVKLLGLIDQFIFSSISVSYLAALMETL